MAITITRRLVQQLRAVIRRVLNVTRTTGPAICISRDPEGLRIRVQSYNAAIEYHDSAAEVTDSAETLWLPLRFLDESQGKKDEPVRIEATTTGRVTAQWRDGNVPQNIQYEVARPAKADAFPALPDDLAENPASILQALHDAGDTTDPASTRYSLGCLRLRGDDGTIAASDGRQLLVQGGFCFPWTGDLLMPRNKVFGSSDLPRDRVVQIGKTGDWVVLCVGPWHIYLRHDQQGRFPKLESHVPYAGAATARCYFSDADAEFLADTLPRLPCRDLGDDPVTVDLNGAVVVRARGADPVPPTEAVARSSTWEGEPVRINTNRRYLARALRLGFRELCFFGDKSPAACFDGQRSYVWALLDHESAIQPNENTTRIESPTCGPGSTASVRQARRRTPAVSETTAKSSANGHAKTPGHATASRHVSADNTSSTSGHTRAVSQARKVSSQTTGPQDLNSLIDRAEALRESLRDTLAKTNELVRGLKQHRRATRTLESTLGSLRQLQTLSL